MYDTILAPVNIASEETGKILTESVNLAEQMNAELYILHAFPTNVPEDVKQSEKELFNETVSDLGGSIDPVILEKDLSPVQAIQEVVSQHSVDLVVITPTNRTKLKKIIMGSVTEKTIEKVDANVLVLSDS